ncbi:MAG: hypothetical protein AAB421_01765 [Patescibacteria group bacterium]
MNIEKRIPSGNDAVADMEKGSEAWCNTMSQKVMEACATAFSEKRLSPFDIPRKLKERAEAGQGLGDWKDFAWDVVDPMRESGGAWESRKSKIAEIAGLDIADLELLYEKARVYYREYLAKR